MRCTVLFWNIWLDNQLGGKNDSAKLTQELKRLCDHYKPDFIGLNEVLKDDNSNTPFVHDFLRDECGYTFNYFAPASRFSNKSISAATNNWTIGAGLCSRAAPDKIRSIDICKDTPAEKRGQRDATVKAIAASFSLSGQNLSIIVAHPLHLRPYTLKDHYRGTKVLEELVRSREFSANTILGCDFNEPDFMPKSFSKATRDILHLRTGSVFNTTWRHNADLRTPIRANLDRLFWTKNSTFSLTSFEVIDTDVSDHRPLVGTFDVPINA